MRSSLITPPDSSAARAPHRVSVISASSGQAGRILDDNVDLWAWRRTLPAPIAAAAAEIAAGPPFSARSTLVADGDPRPLRAMLDAEGVSPESAGARALAADAASLVVLLASVTGARTVRARLQVSHEPACPLYHVDSVPLRLLCTYSGPGTEWLEDRDAVRSQLGLRGRPLDVANASIAPTEVHRQALQAGWVGLLKGSQGAPSGAGVVHRSPQSSEPRLVLVLDPVDGNSGS